jgi:hypothetical protein
MEKFIEQRASFPDKAFKPFAVMLWRELFRMAENFGDVAVCNDNSNGSAISLSLRDSSIYDGDYYALDMADEPFVQIGVDGIDERLFAIPEDDELGMEALGAEVRAWMEEGIMEAFLSAAIQKKYQRYNPEGKRFSIVGDCYESGAFGPDLSLLWSHKKPRFTVAQIRTRQKAARKKHEAPGKKKMRAVMKVKPKPKGKRKKLFPKPFKSEALRGWNDLFAAVSSFHNAIRFEMDAEGGTVTVITYPATSEPQCVSMIITSRVDELVEGEDEREEVTKAFYAWVEKGILESFQSARIQKKYTRFNPDGENCAIVLSKQEECGPTVYELASLDLSILWTNNPKFTVSRIKTQQKARTKKRKAAEKKQKEAEKKKPRAIVLAPDQALIKKLVKEHFKKPFKPKALEIWKDFFEDTEDFHNIAHCAIYPGIGVIKLTAQHSSINESASERINDRKSFCVYRNNWDPMLNKGVSEEDASATFRAWAEQGIMEAFNSARIQNKLQQYNPDDKRFAVLSTVGFHLPMIEDELSLLWNNNPSFTVSRIMSQQKAAIKRGA